MVSFTISLDQGFDSSHFVDSSDVGKVCITGTCEFSGEVSLVMDELKADSADVDGEAECTTEVKEHGDCWYDSAKENNCCCCDDTTVTCSKTDLTGCNESSEDISCDFGSDTYDDGACWYKSDTSDSKCCCCVDGDYNCEKDRYVNVHYEVSYPQRQPILVHKYSYNCETDDVDYSCEYDSIEYESGACWYKSDTSYKKCCCCDDGVYECSTDTDDCEEDGVNYSCYYDDQEYMSGDCFWKNDKQNDCCHCWDGVYECDDDDDCCEDAPSAL